MNATRHRATGPQTPETIDFEVIGELRDNPQHLLLLGDDGQCYCFDMTHDRITPLDPDDSWSVDVVAAASAHLALPIELLAG
jgi:hypothetical protein